MSGNLTKETRLTISVTRLKNGTLKLRGENKILRETIKERDKQIKVLEDKLVDKESQRKELLGFLYKPKKEERDSKPLGKKVGAPAYHREVPKDNQVTSEHTYILKQCPICKDSVGDVVDRVVKYTEDIDLKPRPLVTKHTITRHWCKHCETYVKSNDIPYIPRIGTNTLGYILYSRYRLRLPVGKIKESLFDLYNFKISEGEITEKLQYAKDLFGKDYEAITILIQEAKVVYADETGWRMNGDNWFLWVFVTSSGMQYVIEDTRGKGVAERHGWRLLNK
jgi:transposase